MNMGDPNRVFAQNVVSRRPLADALQDFQRARQRAAVEALVGRFTGRSLELLSFQEIAEKLKVRNRLERGVKEIPVAAIVGSVGRYHDFTRSFLPRNDWDAQRWAGVRAAGHIADLPPIDVYQIGDAYFVLDGNHRVSIARQTGIEYINANVIEVQTRVPFSPDVSPDELIIRAEYGDFLEFMGLDELRPGSDLHVTVPGQYRRLENHIEVHRFFLELAEERDLSDSDAVTCWYDEAYLPLVQAIREQGILRDFPGRTETDLYIWLAEHQAQLRNELGWQVRPDTAVAQFRARLKPRRSLTEAYRRVLRLVIPEGWKGQASSMTADWAQERLLDRYSQTLFGEILVPLTGRQDAALAQAITIAQREHGRVVGLFVGEANEAITRTWFQSQCATGDVTAVWVKEIGSLPEIVARRAALADLVILDQAVVAETAVTAICQHCSRPVLLLHGQPSPISRALLTCAAPRESALFVAAYLAEQWHIGLVISGSKPVLPLVDAYLEMHEVQAEQMPPGDEANTAVPPGCDLVITGQQGCQVPAFKPDSFIPTLYCP